MGLVSLPVKLKVPAMFIAVGLSVVIYTAPESAKLVDHVSPVADVNVACPVKLGPPSTTLPAPVAVNSNCILVPELVEPLMVYVFWLVVTEPVNMITALLTLALSTWFTAGGAAGFWQPKHAARTRKIMLYRFIDNMYAKVGNTEL